jgi:peroxiredoxin
MAKSRKLQPGDQAPNGVAVNVDEREISLADYWAEGPVLLTFLRHFG